ncbi:tetratricopeptide repeat protein [Sphingomonas sp. KRR8]|uniref:tetratricopeptide repeat protein n=1 Tax=Sphingomonas sp. KRR8 TaxID=2942996 RepID=UPI0020221E6D|nr:tetratricopeptide repeat protein [Sphingomonas sp. KRR8]URD59642.1 tetratricopeptide repeat protein [Sphingomonas sp. KRR8]
MIRISVLGACAAAMVLPGSARAQYIGGNAPPPPAAPLPGQVETPGAALARNIRILAGDPRNYQALLGAGQAALASGDAEAAIGFFGRASEVNAASWVPKVGQGASLVQLMDPNAAMQAFAEAQRLGASQGAIALDRGLAYDLLGDQARAQSDYRVALSGTDPNEARRRLALSLAVSGRRAEALAALDPLLARRDPGALRARAFVLALTGDTGGALSAVNAALPGLAGSMDPFLRRLSTLQPAEKIAAVHFGVMPGNGVSGGPAARIAQAPVEDRLGDIDRLLHPAEPQAAAAPQPGPIPAGPPAGRLSPVPTVVPGGPAVPAVSQPVPAAAVQRSRIWLQLASGTDPNALPEQFRRLVNRNRDLFENISGYVAEENGRSRLLIGPFKSTADAQTFAEDLSSVNIDSFSWTSAPGQVVRKLPQ